MLICTMILSAAQWWLFMLCVIESVHVWPKGAFGFWKKTVCQCLIWCTCTVSMRTSQTDQSLDGRSLWFSFLHCWGSRRFKCPPWRGKGSRWSVLLWLSAGSEWTGDKRSAAGRKPGCPFWGHSGSVISAEPSWWPLWCFLSRRCQKREGVDPFHTLVVDIEES